MKRLFVIALIMLTACTSTPATPTPASFFDLSPVPPTLAVDSSPQPIPSTDQVLPTETVTKSVVTGSMAETGELYFFLQPRLSGGTIELVKVSAACITDPINCPPMERIQVPFAFNFTINA